MKVTYRQIDIEKALKKKEYNRQNIVRHFNKLEELQTIHKEYIETREQQAKERLELEKLTNYWKEECL